METAVFRDRRHAGRELARVLGAYADRPDVIVLALPRGGVPIAYEIADSLHAPLDVFIVRKLIVPGQDDYALGALASGGVRVINDNVVRLLGVGAAAVEEVTRAERHELESREHLYRGDRPTPDVHGRTVLLVDDGLASSASMIAAVKALRAKGPERIVVALPAGSVETCDDLRREADAVICATTPKSFRAVGLCYEDFAQPSDDEVRELLSRAWHGARDDVT